MCVRKCSDDRFHALGEGPFYREERDLFVGQLGRLEGCDMEAFRIMGLRDKSDSHIRE